MTERHPGNTICERCKGAIEPDQNRFAAQDRWGIVIIICQLCRDAEHDGIISRAEEGPRP